MSIVGRPPRRAGVARRRLADCCGLRRRRDPRHGARIRPHSRVRPPPGEALITADGRIWNARPRVVCGSCHAYPPPDILPRDNWGDEFVRMMFIREGRLPPIGPPGLANRNVQLPADMEQVLPFYVSRAPGTAARTGALARSGGAVTCHLHTSRALGSRNARHSRGLARAADRSRRRPAARSAGHGHASGAGLQRHSGLAHGRPG